MSAGSKIQWTHHTSNPWWGCTKVSTACTQPYPQRLARRRIGVLEAPLDRAARKQLAPIVAPDDGVDELETISGETEARS